MNDFQRPIHGHAATIFVYGTLQPGGLYWASYCEGRVGNVRPGRVQGKLYDLHLGYPGLRLEGDGWVQGFILDVLCQEDFARIDYLEGYDPSRPEHQNEYLRRRVACFDGSGESLGTAWTYEVSESELARCSGTWLESGVWPSAGFGSPKC